jgi:hypothetical protein
MLCVSLKPYSRTCGSVSGGISDVAIFDPNDLNFTQAADVDGVKQKYSAVEERDGVDGISIFSISFQVDEAEWTWSQSVTGCSTSYEHEFIFQLPENSQELTTFQQALDNAACCCGIGFIFRMNNGKIFVAGEKYVNAATIQRFTLKQDGSEGGSGKLFGDFNGGNIHLKGTYLRNLYEYSGAWSTIELLMQSGGSV